MTEWQYVKSVNSLIREYWIEALDGLMNGEI